MRGLGCFGDHGPFVWSGGLFREGRRSPSAFSRIRAMKGGFLAQVRRNDTAHVNARPHRLHDVEVALEGNARLRSIRSDSKKRSTGWFVTAFEQSASDH